MRSRLRGIVNIFITYLIFVIGLSTAGIADEITGHVMSTDKKPLAGINIILEGTPYGTATDTSGYYRITSLDKGNYFISAQGIGYLRKTKAVFLENVATVDFILEESVVQLSVVTVTGTFATANQIPITFSSLSEKEISDEYSVQDVPLILQNTPGVYVTTDGGMGLGDTQIMIRGFDEKRIQVFVNNIPVNDPESKKVFWSNWGVLSGVTQAIQVQRGAGTSLYGSGALGGSIHIITRDASSDRSTRVSLNWGQYGIRGIGITYNSGLRWGNTSFTGSLNYLEGNGWRENTFYRGLHYYLSATYIPNPKSTLKVILYGSPQYHTLSYYSFDAATYGTFDQFSEDSQINGGTGRKDSYGQYAYGFGRRFNGNVHVAESELSQQDRDRVTKLWDVVFMKARIGAPTAKQIGGWIIAKDRASLDNNISHRPQLEIHHRWQIGEKVKLTSTFFISKGIDYSDNVFPFYIIPRDSNGFYRYETIYNGNYYGADQVFQYRYYSDFFQTGFLSAFEIRHPTHEFSTGFEMRYWKSRHAGEMLNTFGHDEVGVKVGSVEHLFKEGDLFYDFDTEKPQLTLFGRGLWHFDKIHLMTNFQVSEMRYHIFERVPSNNNYPNFLDSTAVSTHGGKTWTGNATWDHDDDPSTPERLVEYTLWDYYRSYGYFSPRLGIDYTVNRYLNVYANWSIGVKEPRVKHFFGYGSPREGIKLERTEDIEMGLRYDGQVFSLPVRVNVNGYRIGFEGKLMQITVPEKANTPGYDYAGHYYVPIGQANYTGVELDGTVDLPAGFSFALNLTRSANTWGEPDGSEGAQKLYTNEAIAGVDYYDADGDEEWDEGSEEYALHQNFVKKYGARVEVGMPQFIIGIKLDWKREPLTVSSWLRYYRDLYVRENNSKIRMGPGVDDIFGSSDDEFSATLPPAIILDVDIRYRHSMLDTNVTFTLHINNVLDTHYWQRGDEYGVAPGSARSVVLTVRLEL